MCFGVLRHLAEHFCRFFVELRQSALNARGENARGSPGKVTVLLEEETSILREKETAASPSILIRRYRRRSRLRVSSYRAYVQHHPAGGWPCRKRKVSMIELTPERRSWRSSAHPGLTPA